MNELWKFNPVQVPNFSKVKKLRKSTGQNPLITIFLYIPKVKFEKNAEKTIIF